MIPWKMPVPPVKRAAILDRAGRARVDLAGPSVDLDPMASALVGVSRIAGNLIGRRSRDGLESKCDEHGGEDTSQGLPPSPSPKVAIRAAHARSPSAAA